MVPDTSASARGNGYVNAHSIGVENEGSRAERHVTVPNIGRRHSSSHVRGVHRFQPAAPDVDAHSRARSRVLARRSTARATSTTAPGAVWDRRRRRAPTSPRSRTRAAAHDGARPRRRGTYGDRWHAASTRSASTTPTHRDERLMSRAARRSTDVERARAREADAVPTWIARDPVGRRRTTRATPSPTSRRLASRAWSRRSGRSPPSIVAGVGSMRSHAHDARSRHRFARRRSSSTPVVGAAARSTPGRRRTRLARAGVRTVSARRARRASCHLYSTDGTSTPRSRPLAG